VVTATGHQFRGPTWSGSTAEGTDCPAAGICAAIPRTIWFAAPRWSIRSGVEPAAESGTAFIGVRRGDWKAVGIPKSVIEIVPLSVLQQARLRQTRLAVAHGRSIERPSGQPGLRVIHRASSPTEFAEGEQALSGNRTQPSAHLRPIHSGLSRRIAPAAARAGGLGDHGHLQPPRPEYDTRRCFADASVLPPNAAHMVFRP
jgi:hypothetical protein